MARIPAEEVERLKREVSVQRLVEARGIELRKHGAADLIGRCPFHDDRTPSLVVSPKKNLWNCLGACGTGGSAIDWVMKAEGVSFRHAVEMLRADAGLSGELPAGRGARKVAKKSSTVKLAVPVERDADDDKLLSRVAAYYHETLKESPEALAYLAERGLRDAELVERFQLGFANRTLGYRLPHKNRKAGAELRGQLQKLGILRQSGHEHFNGSLVVPIYGCSGGWREGERGQVVEMYGRKVTPGLRKGTPLHLYLPGPHRGVWNVEALAASRDVILCESLIDAMTFWCAGHRNVTASYGTGGFTDEHLDAFRTHGIKRVLIAYDRDAAGDAAADKLAERLACAGIGAYRIQFPKGMDANEYAQTMAPADKALALAIRKAVWMSMHRPAEVAPPPDPEPASTDDEHENAGVASDGEGDADADAAHAEHRAGGHDGADAAANGDCGARRREAAQRSWDWWQERALLAGVSAELAELGRRVLREIEQHGWPDEIAARCWEGDGATMIEAALAEPEQAARRWDYWLESDGGRGHVTADGEFVENAVPVLEPPAGWNPVHALSPAAAAPTAAPSGKPSLPSLAALPEPAAASVAPGGATPREPEVAMHEAEHEVTFAFGDRRVRVRGLSRNKSYDQLKVNVLITVDGHGEAFFVDTLDLYSARHRAAYIQQAADELGVQREVVKKDLGQVLLKLEALQEQAIAAQLEPERPAVVLSADERAEALRLLQDPKLCEQILADFDRCGVVGEETNKLVGYLAATSRKLSQPLAVVVQSSSAAGKSSLMESVLAFVPDEERIKYSAMTGQSLYYLGETELSHKVLAIVEEEGAERASYALKLLQSEGELTIASTGKDPQTGKLVTSEYRVEGPVMIFLTTTAIEIDEELLNRCLVLTVDETAEQTAAIHERQRHSRTLAGLLGRRDKENVLRVHQNAQRLLRPLAVVNPYADKLTFAAHKTRMRRDHVKYLTLIDTIALLHQYQREVKTVTHGGQTVEYIEVTPGDIGIANRLCHQVLGRTLDELPPQTRRLLGLLDDLVQSACAEHGIDRSDFRFSRRQVRERTGWGNTQLKVHLARLVEMEYLAVHRGAHPLSYVYELCCGGVDGGGMPRLSGLAEADALGACYGYDANRSGQNGHRSGSDADRSGVGRPLVGARSAPGRSGETGATSAQTAFAGENGKPNRETAHVERRGNGASYANEPRAAYATRASSNAAAPSPAEA